MMKTKIEKQIKELYGSKASYCREKGLTIENSTRHIDRLIARADKINKEMKDLRLKFEITDL